MGVAHGNGSSFVYKRLFASLSQDFNRFQTERSEISIVWGCRNVKGMLNQRESRNIYNVHIDRFIAAQAEHMHAIAQCERIPMRQSFTRILYILFLVCLLITGLLACNTAPVSIT